MSDILELTFLGQTYRFRTDETDVDVNDVAAYVEETLNKVEHDYAGLPPGRIMIMAALHMGRDYVSLRNELEAYRHIIREQTDLIDREMRDVRPLENE